MRPVKSTARHDPTNGKWGNCHSACVASILEIDIEDVPTFYDERSNEECQAHLKSWLLTRGVVQVEVPYLGTHSIHEVLRTVENVNPGVYYIMGVKSPTMEDVGHSVVGIGGKIVHDPSFGDVDLDQYGPILGQDGNRYWWLTYFASAQFMGEDKPAALTTEAKQG